MQELKSDSEILEFAIAREIDAYRLYMRLAEKVTKDSVRERLQELAAEELKHKENLELELVKQGFTARTAGEIPDLGSDTVVISESDAVTEMTMEEILRWAAQKEHYAYRLYIDLAAMTRDAESRDMLIEIAAQEVLHQMRFEQELAALEDEQ